MTTLVSILRAYSGMTVAALLSTSSAAVTNDTPQLNGARIDAAVDYYRLQPRSAAALRSPLPRGRCTNINRVMEVELKAREKLIADVSRAGFRLVRIPLDVSAHASWSPPYTVDGGYLRETIALAGIARSNGLFAIFDFHRYGELSKNPQSQRTRFLAIWDQLSAAWSQLPSDVAFEIINEPRESLTPAVYAPLLKQAISVIRRNNPDRIVIADAPWVAHFKGLPRLDLPANDKNVIPSFHYYDPMSFTHQNASWMTSYKGRSDFGSPADLQNFSANVQAVASYITASRRVPFAGEFGVIDNVPTATRLRYMTLVAEGFASIGVPTCAWTWDSSHQAFTIQQGAVIYPGFQRALISPR